MAAYEIAVRNTRAAPLKTLTLLMGFARELEAANQRAIHGTDYQSCEASQHRIYY